MTNVFQFGSGYRVFSSYWWKHFVSPGTYLNPLVFAYQRATRGWADCDTWDFDLWLCDILPSALEHLRTHTHGYPCEMTEEKWDKILSEIAEGFRAAERSKETPEEFIRELETSTGISAKLGLKDKEYDWVAIKAYQDAELAKFHKGMKLFVKYFHNLWD